MKNVNRIIGVSLLTALVSVSAQAGLLRNSAPGDTVTYTAITEGLTTVGGGTLTGSYGTPGINGDQLVFSSVNIESQAFGGNFSRGDAQLDFFVEAHSGYGIDKVQIGERGESDIDELVIPSGGGATTRTEASATLQVDILEVDGNPYYGPDGSTGGTFASFSLPVDGTALYLWNGGLEIDVEQILIDGGYEFVFGATKLEVTLDNLLYAYSEANTLATIKKKGADALSITAYSIPEPASAVLLVGMSSGLMFVRRRFIS